MHPTIQTTLRAFKAYPALARAAWERAQAYRAVFVVTLLNAAFPLVMMAIWVELAREAPVGGFSAGDFVGYYLGAVLVRRITSVSLVGNIERWIHTGELSSYLLRPIHVWHVFFVRTMINRGFVVLLLLLAISIGAWVTPGAQFDLRPATLALFVLACVLGLLFEFFAQLALAGLAFWVVQVQGAFAAFQFVKSFLGGYIVPLALFPLGLGGVLKWLPFSISVALPVEILTGQLTVDDTLTRLLAGAGWIGLTFVITRRIWETGLRSYSAVGA